ncbi:MAG: hypothetical protein IKO58_01755 [Prevotella sp.]|nr:hypothetical protein [Prevotella sp.]
MKKNNVAIVGNVTGNDASVLNNMLGAEGMSGLYTFTLYGADGQPEQDALRDAIDDCLDEEIDIDSIVCLPLTQAPQKAVRHALADDSATILPVMICDETRFITVEPDDIAKKAALLEQCLKRDLSILMPRIAIISSDSEQADNIKKMQEKGNSFFGPFSPELLESEEARAFDALIIADKDNKAEEQIKKLLDDKTPVTLLTGIALSVVATEPSNIYDALALATDVVKNRISYDFPLKNPLPKLFVEKKEDGDKARFAKKKGGFDPAAHKRENVTYNTKAPAEEAPVEEPMVEES